MSPPDPAGHDAGSAVARAIMVLAWVGGAVLMIAVVSTAGRWLV